MSFDRGQAKTLLDQVMARLRDGDLEAELVSRRASNTRFARNEITTAGHVEDVTLTVAARKDGRTGTIASNDLAAAGLEEAVRRAVAARDLMPADPEWVPTLPPQTYPALPARDAEAARAGAAERAPGVRAALSIAARRSLTAAGFYENVLEQRAIANSLGNFGWHETTTVAFSSTMRTADGTGSGWASAVSPRFGGVDPKSVARRAADKGTASAHPRTIAPGDYTVVLEPAAVTALLQTLSYGALSKRAADEGRGAFSKTGGGTLLGEKVAHESVTLTSDPFDARIPARPWSGGVPAGGLPSRRVPWIEKGILKTLYADRYWAAKTNAEPTPFPGAFVMAGGPARLEDLIASTDRGLLVTRFWYIRTVNPQTWQLTGLTRDGLFLIEKGRVAGPVVNLRFNESPLVMLQNVEAMTAAESAEGMVVPAIKSRSFTFTSTSDAV